MARLGGDAGGYFFQVPEIHKAESHSINQERYLLFQKLCSRVYGFAVFTQSPTNYKRGVLE